MAKVAKDLPLAEITLRKYAKPYRLDDRELVKKLCLSVGLLQPGDSRDVIVDVLHAFISAKETLTSQVVEQRVIASRKNKKLSMTGIASSNIRRQLKRLRDAFILERHGNSYRISEDAPLAEIFEEKIEKYHLRTIVERVREYCEALDKQRNGV